MAQNQIDLAKLFQITTKNLKAQKETLNEADTYNHDHGDHMVEIFDVITQAVKEKKNADPADQLAYASQLLRKQKSGSAAVYADNFKQASQEVKQSGGQLDLTMILRLIQSILGGGSGSQGGDIIGTLLGSLLDASGSQGSAQGGDLLGSLLGGLMGGSSQPQTQTQGSQGGDLLGSLLGGLMGGSSQPQAQTQNSQGGDLLGSLLGGLMGSSGSQSGSQGGIDLGSLLGLGMQMMGGKAANNVQSSGDPLSTLAGMLASGSTLAEKDYRKQSGEVVADSMLHALNSLLRGK